MNVSESQYNWLHWLPSLELSGKTLLYANLCFCSVYVCNNDVRITEDTNVKQNNSHITGEDPSLSFFPTDTPTVVNSMKVKISLTLPRLVL